MAKRYGEWMVVKADGTTIVSAILDSRDAQEICDVLNRDSRARQDWDAVHRVRSVLDQDDPLVKMTMFADSADAVRAAMNEDA